jgi:hypothetical protein
MTSTRTVATTLLLVACAFGAGWFLKEVPAREERSEIPRKPVTVPAEPEYVPPARPVEPAAPAEIEPVAEPEPEPAPFTEEDLRKELGTFGRGIGHLLVNDEEAAGVRERLRDALRRAGPEGIARLLTRLEDEAEPLGARFVLAHALAQSGDPVAIEALENHLRDADSGMLLHRFASHALAFCDAEGMEVFLSEIANTAEDRGVRANTGFGLARRGSDEGLRVYLAAADEAFETGDPSAIQYLGGLGILGEPGFPAIRERLLTYESKEALVLLIHFAKEQGDRGALPALERLAYDAARPESVQKAAQGAIKALTKQPQ